MATAQELYPEAYEICKKFVLSDEKLAEVMKRMNSEIEMGLAKNTHNQAIIKCWITYVQDLPSGKETGKYLALDLGGTNFRVLMVTLKGNGEVAMQTSSYEITKEFMEGPGTQLFDHIADCLARFAVDHDILNANLPLGFTFSFPVEQFGIAHGHLVAWTKGFNCSGVVGEDVVRLLEEAIARRGDVKIRIVALLNDTTGTLMSCAYKHTNCRIGLIVGTGCNACYVEKTSRAEMFEGPSSKPVMIINCEWGAFGDNGVLDFVRTEYDKIVDGQTLNRGNQLFEKCISGMYLGELVRLIMLDLIKQKVLFDGQYSASINEKWKFGTKYISEIEMDSGKQGFRNTNIVLDHFGIRNAPEKDLAMIHYICETISTRSACLVAAGLACLANRMNNSDITIGVDGGVYRFHPHYRQRLDECMQKLVKSHIKYNLVTSDDGSGRGAALIAAVVDAK